MSNIGRVDTKITQTRSDHQVVARAEFARDHESSLRSGRGQVVLRDFRVCNNIFHMGIAEYYFRAPYLLFNYL